MRDNRNSGSHMRTISAQHKKGQEPHSRVIDNARILLYICRVALDYFIVGYPIRRKFARLQRSGEKFYLD